MTQVIGFDIVVKLKSLKTFSIHLIFFLYLKKKLIITHYIARDNILVNTETS